jgi:hypothetical protein
MQRFFPRYWSIVKRRISNTFQSFSTIKIVITWMLWVPDNCWAHARDVLLCTGLNDKLCLIKCPWQLIAIAGQKTDLSCSS